MSFDHLNIGQLLFLLPNAELKQRVRNLERFYKRYISAKTGILFNKTYIWGIYIHIHTNIHKHTQIYVSDEGLPGYIIISDNISRHDWDNFFKFIK